jgi:hypothetical protein
MFHMARLSVSESSVDPSFDQFKLLPGLPESLSTRIGHLIMFARLPTAEVGSTGARALVLLRSVLDVPYGAAFSI